MRSTSAIEASLQARFTVSPQRRTLSCSKGKDCNFTSMDFNICKNLVISLSRKNNLLSHKPHCTSLISPVFFSSRRPNKILKEESTTDVSSYLINQHQFSPEAALKVSSVVNCLKNTKKTDLTFLYLKECGFSNSHVEEVIKRVPSTLSANLERTLKPKIKIFQDLGFTPSDISEIIVADPWIITRSAEKLGPSILVLKSVMGSNECVSKLLKISGWFLKHNLEKTMMPNIEFMKGCGISSSQLTKFVFNFPRFFLHKPETIKGYVKRVDEMGGDRSSKMFLHAIRVMSSMTADNWELKLKLFRSMGFSENDIVSVFKRVPQVFAVSERKIKAVTQILLSSGKYDMSFVVQYPELLICSVERRIKPSLELLNILERKNLPEKKPSLTTLCKVSNKIFIERYVIPYSNELGDHFKQWQHIYRQIAAEG